MASWLSRDVGWARGVSSDDGLCLRMPSGGRSAHLSNGRQSERTTMSRHWARLVGETCAKSVSHTSWSSVLVVKWGMRRSLRRSHDGQAEVTCRVVRLMLTCAYNSCAAGWQYATRPKKEAVKTACKNQTQLARWHAVTGCLAGSTPTSAGPLDHRADRGAHAIRPLWLPRPRVACLLPRVSSNHPSSTSA